MNAVRVAIAVLAIASWAARSLAQDDLDHVPLYQQDPYDQITVDEKNGGGTYKVLPLELPDRKLPVNPAADDLLTVRMLDDRNTSAQIAWQHIVKVELFEQLVLAEAQRLAAQQEFDTAFDYFEFLHENYPQLVGLAEAARDYRYRNAGALFRQQRYAEALALLEEVYRDEPQRSGLSAALANVSQPLFEAQLQNEHFAAARQLVARTAQRSDAAAVKLSQAWQARLEADARAQESAARAHVGADRFREASATARRMLAIWPQLPGGSELAQQIALKWPLARVGVGRLRPTLANFPLETTSERTAVLTRPSLVLLSHFGPDGAVYTSPWGELTAAENRRGAALALNVSQSSGPSGYDLAQGLLHKCDEKHAAYDPLWAATMKSVRVADVYRVEIELQHAQPQPLSSLMMSWPDSSGFSPRAPYVAEPQSAGAICYVASGNSLSNATAPREVVETVYPSPAAALAELRGGRLDVIERLPPAEVDAIAQMADVVVGRYAVPRVHVLVPNLQRPYPANGKFRRAIACGLARELTLRDEVLRGATVAGCRTISGPFPVGDTKAAWGYAYDQEVQPLAYEPRLALTLLRVAEDELARAASARKSPAPRREKIVIGHGGDWLERRVCDSFAEQLTRIGIECAAHDLSTALPANAGECDFWYAELCVTEPLVDAPRLFSDSRLADVNPYLRLALRDIVHAANWQQASDRLHALHRLVHADQTVIPLWQLVDHFATRADFLGPADDTVSLYRQVDRWRPQNVVGAPMAER